MDTNQASSCLQNQAKIHVSNNTNQQPNSQTNKQTSKQTTKNTQNRINSENNQHIPHVPSFQLPNCILIAVFPTFSSSKWLDLRSNKCDLGRLFCRILQHVFLCFLSSLHHPKNMLIESPWKSNRTLLFPKAWEAINPPAPSAWI